jgi:sarcosine oxidase gamma subunit
VAEGDAMSRPLLKLIEDELYVVGPDEWVIREGHSIEDVLVHLIEEAGGEPDHLVEVIRLIEQESR